MNLRNLLPEKRAASGLWWGRPWSLVDGCSKCSAGCAHCWSEAVAMRFGNCAEGTVGPDGWTGLVVPREDRLDLPLRTRRPAIFTVWNDLFHENAWDESFLGVAFLAMSLRPDHAFLVLTKRAARMREMLDGEDAPVAVAAANEGVWMAADDQYGPASFPAAAIETIRRRLSYADATGMHWPLPNVGLGVSVEDQETAAARIPELLLTPAALRWVNVGPLLGPVDLRMLRLSDGENPEMVDALTGVSWFQRSCLVDPHDWTWPEAGRSGVGWVVIECESGPTRRPCELAWVEDLVRQCRVADVPCWVKQIQVPRRPKAWLRAFLKNRKGIVYPHEWEGRCGVFGNRVSKDMSEWPEALRVREMPEMALEESGRGR